MVGRGNRATRGRGGNFKRQTDNVPIHQRLGNMPTYQSANVAKRDKFKYVKAPATITASLAPIPPEPRIKSLSKKFLRSYYEIFDQPATIPLPTYGRNLIEVIAPTERISLLVHEKANIARALATSFPPTEHLVSALNCDIPFYVATPMSVSSMQIIVTGVFKDTSQTTNPLRAFTRVFLLKQISNDKQGDPVYEIFNDLFMLQPPTPDQIKKFHHDTQIAKRVSTTSQPNSSVTGDNNGPTQRIQSTLIQSIMAKTKMNSTGAKQLLLEAEWDADKALAMFNTLMPKNGVPHEFFTP